MIDRPILKKLDIHVHCRYDEDNAGFCTASELRAFYESINVERALLLPSRIGDVHDKPFTGAHTGKELCQTAPDTLGWWFCNLDRRAPLGSPLDECEPCWSATEDLSVTLLRYKAMGAKGVGELTAHLEFTSDYMQNLFHHAERCGMPVLFHMGNMDPKDYGIVDSLGLPGLEYCLKNFPNLKFFGHSQKFWAEIGTDVTEENRKGFPKGPVEPGRVVELMRRYPNLCGDLSATSGYNAVTRDPEFGVRFLEEFADRLYFGTDVSSPSQMSFKAFTFSAYLDTLMLEGKISYDTYERVSRKNLLTLMGEE